MLSSPKSRLDPPYEVLLGSDVFYGWNPTVVVLLAEAIPALSGKGGITLLTTPSWPAEGGCQIFEDLLTPHGFEIRDISEKALVAQIIAAVGVDRGPLRVIELLRRGSSAGEAHLQRCRDGPS